MFLPWLCLQCSAHSDNPFPFWASVSLSAQQEGWTRLPAGSLQSQYSKIPLNSFRYRLPTSEVTGKRRKAAVQKTKHVTPKITEGQNPR